MEEVTFPNEVWLEIFKKIDRPKLMKLRLVSHRFYDLIEHLLNKDPEWKKLVYEINSFESLDMTMQRANPYYLVTHRHIIDDPVLWRRTYLSYKKWKRVLINPHTKDIIVPATNLGKISCICTFDKYIAISFNNGSIASYTIDNIIQPFYLTNHGTSIIQIEFWYSNGDVLIVSVGHDYTLKFWDLQKKIEIATTNSFFAKNITSGECRHFCIGDMGGILTSYERVGEYVSRGPTLDLKLREDEQIIAHVVDGQYMTAVAWYMGGTVQFEYHGVIKDGKLIEFKIDKRNHWNPFPENVGALQRLSLPASTLFFGIGKSSIALTCSSDYYWHEYNLSQHFGCHVKSIALHARILMFGLEDGSIHLLYMPHYGAVRRLGGRIKHSKKIKVDTEPIVNLTVLEVDNKPSIVAVTDQKVYLINFF